MNTWDAALKVRTAIRKPGPAPHHHWTVMERHRSEWPTLWKALDELLDSVENPTDDTPFET